MRGYREINQIEDKSKRILLNELKKELYDLCDMYKIEKPSFMVNISAKHTNGNIKWIPGTKKVRFISISIRHLKEEFKKQLSNTIKHEFAHMYTLVRFNKVDHGRTWKLFHMSIGGNGQRCTNYGGSVATMAENDYKYIYHCKCGVDIRRTRKIADERAGRLYCTRCHTYVKDMRLEQTR